jgi:TonB-linked SusC/RagA family outer membrane protein
MQMKRHSKKGRLKHAGMVLLIVLAFATADAQTITLSLNNATLEKTFREVEQQVHHRFVYTTEMLEGTKPVSITIKGASLEKALEVIFRNQPLEFSVDEGFIRVRYKTHAVPERMEVSGRVMNEDGEVMSHVSISTKPSGRFAVTDETGGFLLHQVEVNETLVFTSVGYADKIVQLEGQRAITVQMSISVSELDKTVVIAYGTTSRRLSTGNVTKVSGAEIEQQPVNNVMAALSGRVPGMVVTQTSGVPGAAFTIQIRGRTTLDALLSANDPLIVIDGVPFAPGNSVVSQTTSAANNPKQQSEGGISPLNSINPADIESIEVLKDADATAIYGSRGANGVILITTKKGKAGKSRFDLNVYTGAGKVTRTMDMMNTQQYVAMRKEAFANDGVTPTVSNARDLLVWDTTRYTDLKKLFIGGKAHTTNVQANYSGGNANAIFLVGAGYRKETTVFPGDLSDQAGSLHFAFTNHSTNQKFTLQLTGNYSYQVNRLLRTDLTSYINLPPNILLYDSLGKPNWSENGGAYTSVFSTTPAAELLKTYSFQSENLIQNLSIGYRLFKGMHLKSSFGYNSYKGEDVVNIPKASLPTTSSTLASSNFGNTSIKSWITEPQIDYLTEIGAGRLTVLIGASLQEVVNKAGYTSATNYTNDLLLNSMAAAGALNSSNDYQQYRYEAVFGRLRYELKKRYLLNLTGRRDGSSRFGPRRQFANFGAVGAGWIFSEEGFAKKALKFLSYGKLRGSYGITGNDQIGNYRFLKLWTNTSAPYQGMPGLAPVSLFNPDFGWEINKKAEGAIELGFLKDHLLFSLSYYQNRSSNQLVSYILPIQTGFGSVVKNLPALVKNEGAEVTVTIQHVETKRFGWESVFNIAGNRNRLVSFPGLSSTSYASLYVEGQPLSLIRKYRYLGVDATTGIYRFEDVNKDGLLSTADYQVLGSSEPKFYGGFQNRFRWKGFELDVFLEYRKQRGSNYLTFQNKAPGVTGLNQPLVILERWQKAGDIAPVQRFTQSVTTAYTAVFNLLNSDGVYSDASYIRFKNVSLYYSLPLVTVKKAGLESCRVYVTGQNLVTLTRYKGADPETQNLYRLPPLKILTCGIQIKL